MIASVDVMIDGACMFVCFVFKQKTAYEMRISDWSSDVCSSDLQAEAAERLVGDRAFGQIVTDLAIAIFFGRFDLDRHSHVAHFEFPRLKSRLSVRSADDPIPPRRGRNARARRVRRARRCRACGRWPCGDP